MVLKPNLFMDFYTRKMHNHKNKTVEYMEFSGYTAM